VIKLRLTEHNLFVLSNKYDVLHRLKFGKSYFRNLAASRRHDLEAIELRGEILAQLNKLNKNEKNALEFDSFEEK